MEDFIPITVLFKRKDVKKIKAIAEIENRDMSKQIRHAVLTYCDKKDK